MHRRPAFCIRLWRSALAWLVCALLASTGLAHAQRAELPDTLVVQFEPSASALQHAEIRSAIARELGVPLAQHGGERAALLTVGLSSAGELVLTYQPERARLSRSVPLSDASAVAVLAAQLAGNLVRDEAGALLHALRPSEPASQQSTAAGAPAYPVASPAASVPQARCKPDDPQLAREAAAPAAERAGHASVGTPRAYLHDAWVTTVLGGGSFGPNEHGAVSLQQSRRIGRFELGLGAELAIGRNDARFTGDAAGSPELDVRVTEVQLTVPLSLDVRLFGGEDGYFQLGAAVGYRLAGVLSGSNLSGSEGDVALALRASAGVAVGERHGVVLRASWGLTPKEHTISTSGVTLPDDTTGDGTVQASAFDTAIQIGYQVGWR